MVRIVRASTPAINEARVLVGARTRRKLYRYGKPRYAAKKREEADDKPRYPNAPTLEGDLADGMTVVDGKEVPIHVAWAIWAERDKQRRQKPVQKDFEEEVYEFLLSRSNAATIPEIQQHFAGRDVATAIDNLLALHAITVNDNRVEVL